MSALLAVALLATSIVASDDPRVAPPVPPWPVELPAAVDVAGGVLLPDALAAVVHHRLLILDGYPAQCQATLDALDSLWRLDSDAAVAKALAEQAPAPWWQSWAIAGGVAGAFVGGVALGVWAAAR